MANYISSREDLDILGLLTQPSLAPTGARASGYRKLAQRALILFLKDADTASEPSLDGTGVLGARAGNCLPAILDNILSAASATVYNRVVMSTPEGPASERLESFSASSTPATERDGMVVTLSVTSAAGVSDSVLM